MNHVERFEAELDAEDRQWVTIDAPTQGIAEVDDYVKCINQFDVEHSRRYAPKPGKTWCNIFVSDVTRALWCEIPHWVMPDNTPTTFRFANVGARELSVNKTLEIMGDTGSWGWLPCTWGQAIKYANAGTPAIVAAPNAFGHGHIAMVLPSHTSQTHVAQAGLACSSRTTLLAGFGVKHIENVRYYYHAGKQ